jgi:hypothetical protein
VYGRLETAAGEDVPEIAALRLTALLHEAPPDRIAPLLAGTPLSRLAPTVAAVVAAFGDVWKIGPEAELAGYVAAHRPYLRPLLLFELAHEGRAIPRMEDAARRGGLARAFDTWTARLATAGSAVVSGP